MEIRTTLPSIVLRRNVAALRRDRLGLQARDQFNLGLSASERYAVTYWLHRGLTPGEIAAAIGLAERHVVRYLEAITGDEWRLASERARSVTPAGLRRHSIRQAREQCSSPACDTITIRS